MQDAPEDRNLRFLRRLVTLLTMVMIGGLLVVITLLVIRLGDRPAPEVTASQIDVPAGTRVVGYTETPDWIALVTAAHEILIYDRAGVLRETIALGSPAD